MRLEQLASVMTPDTVARPLFYVSKSKKRMMTLIGKTQSFRATLSSLESRDAEDAESSSSESSGGDEPKRNRRKRREREEKKDQLGPEDEWSADFSGCQVGAFAVIHAKYDTGCGLSIVKVATVEKQNSLSRKSDTVKKKSDTVKKNLTLSKKFSLEKKQFRQSKTTQTDSLSNLQYQCVR